VRHLHGGLGEEGGGEEADGDEGFHGRSFIVKGEKWSVKESGSGSER
jgi:hypothetical protein